MLPLRCRAAGGALALRLPGVATLAPPCSLLGVGGGGLPQRTLSFPRSPGARRAAQAWGGGPSRSSAPSRVFSTATGPQQPPPPPPLSDDPTMLKLLLAAKDGELRAKDEVVRAKDEVLRAKDEAMAAANARVLALEHRLGCRSALEIVENRRSALRRSNPYAERLEVWKEIFDTNPGFFEKMVWAVDLGEWGQGMTPKQLQGAVAWEVTKLYQAVSADIHHPGMWATPIQVRFLGPNGAAMMICCCEEAPVAYAVFDAGGVYTPTPPPEVARLLGMGAGAGAGAGAGEGGVGEAGTRPPPQGLVLGWAPSPLPASPSPSPPPPPEGGARKRGRVTRQARKSKWT